MSIDGIFDVNDKTNIQFLRIDSNDFLLTFGIPNLKSEVK